MMCFSSYYFESLSLTKPTELCVVLPFDAGKSAITLVSHTQESSRTFVKARHTATQTVANLLASTVDADVSPHLSHTWIGRSGGQCKHLRAFHRPGCRYI